MVKMSHRIHGNGIFTNTFSIKINSFNVSKYSRSHGIIAGIVKHYTTRVCCGHKMVFPSFYIQAFCIQVHLAKLSYFTNLDFSWNKGNTISLTRTKTLPFSGQIGTEKVHNSVVAFTSFLPASSHFNLVPLGHFSSRSNDVLSFLPKR